MAASKQKLKQAMAQRVARKKQLAEKPVFDLKQFCFDKQLDFILSPNRFKTAVCSRRAGKTVACAADLMNTVSQHQEGDVLYISLTRKSAKKIIWRDLLQLNKEYELAGDPNNQDLTITMPHGKNPTIHISGAKDASEIEKFRGMKFRKVYIDEAQSFRPYIKDLIEDVIEPCLVDYDGSLSIIGTPGPIPAGFFYDVCHNAEWANFKWTMADNPHIERLSGKPVQQILAELRARRGINSDDPSYMREWLGLWVQDFDSLVYHFDSKRNTFSELPADLEYVFGIDIGYHDADAIAVLGYSLSTNKVYLVEEHIKRRQGITPLVEQIKALQAKYGPVKIVIDTGGLGKKIEEEIRSRHHIPVHAAEKTRKFEFIELLNDDLRTGKLQAFEGSVYEQDSYILQWNKDDPHKLKISDNYHTDIGDAVLYAWRECKHFIERDVVKKISNKSDEYMRQLEDEEAAKLQFRKENPDWEILEEYDKDMEELQKLINEF